MRYRKSITILVTVIILLSLIATIYGIFSSKGDGEFTFKSIFGETISIYGKGLYNHDSTAMASQAIAQDYVTLILGIPLLVISLYSSRRGLLKGKLLLAGTLGYFLYTYASYSFLSMYNSFFLIYVLLMSASFFAFTLLILSFDIPDLPRHFSEKLPAKWIGSFLMFVSILFGLMWLGKIVPPLLDGTPPAGLEHYTTMVIQALDLGFVIPISIFAGIMLIKRKPIGYLLASIMILKESTLLTALSLMALMQSVAGIKGAMGMFWGVILLNIIVLFCMYFLLKNIKDTAKPGTANLSA